MLGEHFHSGVYAKHAGNFLISQIDNRLATGRVVVYLFLAIDAGSQRHHARSILDVEGVPAGIPAGPKMCRPSSQSLPEPFRPEPMVSVATLVAGVVVVMANSMILSFRENAESRLCEFLLWVLSATTVEMQYRKP